MVVNRGVAKATPVSRPPAAVSEADGDHTRRGSYTYTGAGSPFWWSGKTTGTRVSARANDDYNN